MNKTQIRNSFLLLLTAIIWGSAFVAQSVGMEYVEPFTFTFTRSIIGGIVLIPVIALLRKARSTGMRRDAYKEDVATQPHLARESVETDSIKGKARSAGMRRDAQRVVRITKSEWLGGICCGIALCAASNFQQIGMLHTTVGKAGFITALYVVIVPILGLFLKKTCADSDLVLRRAFCSGPLSALHAEGGVYTGTGRSSGINLCGTVFISYFNH